MKYFVSLFFTLLILSACTSQETKVDSAQSKVHYDLAQELAKYILLRSEELPDITDGALFYHASYINVPNGWNKKKVTTKIDTHIFYRPNNMRL